MKLALIYIKFSSYLLVSKWTFKFTEVLNNQFNDSAMFYFEYLLNSESYSQMYAD